MPDRSSRRASDRDQIRALFETPVTEVTRVSRPWRRNGRRFVQVRVEVPDIRRLSEARPVRVVARTSSTPGTANTSTRRRSAPSALKPGTLKNYGWDGSEIVAFRLHLPSKILFHNARDLETNETGTSRAAATSSPGSSTSPTASTAGRSRSRSRWRASRSSIARSGSSPARSSPRSSFSSCLVDFQARTMTVAGQAPDSKGTPGRRFWSRSLGLELSASGFSVSSERTCHAETSPWPRGQRPRERAVHFVGTTPVSVTRPFSTMMWIGGFGIAAYRQKAGLP